MAVGESNLWTVGWKHLLTGVTLKSHVNEPTKDAAIVTARSSITEHILDRYGSDVDVGLFLSRKGLTIQSVIDSLEVSYCKPME